MDRLYVRTDWGLVRLIYLPALFLLALAAMFLPALAALKLRVGIGCSICQLLEQWGHRAEEWYNAKPLLALTDDGLAYEDGGPRVIYGFTELTGIAIQRRIAPWLTNGHASINPRYWLTLQIRNPKFGQKRTMYFRSYDEPEFLFINVWPREVAGGLLRLRRFAGSLKQSIESHSSHRPKTNLP